MTSETVKLTQFSHGAGCGCKIAPQVLDKILKTNLAFPDHEKLLVGNSSKDDAAVYDLGNGLALISTTDFFMPIVDDAFDFGRIAAANAISDVYAMGGKPLMAIAVLGWPVEKLPPELAQKVIEGGRSMCKEAGIPLAGGHSIDSPEPIFGLAVSGIVSINNLKKNSTAQEGDLLFLTKPLGIGILSTAQKKGFLKEEHLSLFIQQLTTLNSIGEILGGISGVTAMTDVTGFGLLGHLIEMAEGSNLSAVLSFEKIPTIISDLGYYVDQHSIPGGTHRNWDSYENKVGNISAFQKALLADPQTNGGLLITVNENAVEEVKTLLKNSDLGKFSEPIGRMQKAGEKMICVVL